MNLNWGDARHFQGVMPKSASQGKCARWVTVQDSRQRDCCPTGTWRRSGDCVLEAGADPVALEFH